VHALAVLLFQMGVVGLIYWPTRKLAFVSDAWVYLERFRHGLWAAVGEPVGYHWQPIACAWIAAIRGVFGERPAAFQAMNLVQLSLIGHLTFQLGRRLLQDWWAAFFASLLVLGSAAFYEASYWVLAGNMHLLAALLYVLSVILAYDVARGRLPSAGRWLLGLTVLAAVFSHPAMVTSLAVCALVLLVVPRDHPGDEPGGALGHRPRALLPLAAVAVLFALSRLRFNPLADLAPKPGVDLERIFWLVERGLIGVFSLRGSLDFVSRLLRLGTWTALSDPGIWLCLGAWLAAAAAAAGLCLNRGPVGVRLLVVFLTIHLAVLTLAGGLTPRQCVIPSVFAALLTVWALRAGSGRLARRFTTSAQTTLCLALPAVIVAVLIGAARADHRIAARVHMRAADASRALVARIASAAAGRGRVDLTLINMPSVEYERGLSAFAFANGLGEMAHLTSTTVGKVELWRIPVRGTPAYLIEQVPLLGRAALRAQLSEPYRVVLLYEEEPIVVRALTLADMDQLTAR
jgi:hypothetical protein